MTPLQTTVERESLLLAPFAMHSGDSRGREHPEPSHPYRGPFQRDRDRVLHSWAFRRLSGKTQVFTGEMGDYHRTRLTHTQEVASIARTIGRALRLNEDLIEALALFHDIGHPPFGHAGEDALNECLEGEGGFSHNRYALTIARELEERYSRFAGLNLTFEMLDGQASRADKQNRALPPPLLEAQVVDAADSITYDAHDADDAVKLRLVKMETLAEVPLVQQAIDTLPSAGSIRDPMLRRAVVRQLIDLQVNDLLELAGQALKRERPLSAQAARQISIGPSPQLAPSKLQLEKFLYRNVYRHPQIVRVRARAQQRLKRLFDGYVRYPERLPPRFRQRAEQVGLRRSAGDYLAGMTDRFCDTQFQRHFGSGGGD